MIIFTLLDKNLDHKDESFNFINSPFGSDNDLLLFEFDEKIEEFPKKNQKKQVMNLAKLVLDSNVYLL